jgi:hypothetical protein
MARQLAPGKSAQHAGGERPVDLLDRAAARELKASGCGSPRSQIFSSDSMSKVPAVSTEKRETSR